MPIIGKGVQHESLDLVKVTLRMIEVVTFKHKHSYEGEEFITFEVAKLQQPDKFNQHTLLLCVC
jgi:hypothetical protein